MPPKFNSLPQAPIQESVKKTTIVPILKKQEVFTNDGIVSVSKNNKNLELAPEGWKTNGSLVEVLDASKYIIDKISEKYRITNPEWFKEYKNKLRFTEYYSPELVVIISNEIKLRENAPEGWKTNGTLSNELIVDNKTISRITKKYRITNPEWLKDYKDQTGGVTEHYSPELVTLISKEINSQVHAPEGWKTNKGLAEELNISKQTIANISKKYWKTNPEWFKEYKSKGGVTEHYSPELVVIISNEIKLRENAPEGWKTNNSLAQDLNVVAATVARITKKYRITNPEWLKDYKDQTGGVTEHYSPELVTLISKEINSQVHAPEGWKTNKGLAEELNIDKQKITNISKKYRKTNPEWFKEYKSKGGVTEHYSPEFVVVILNDIKSLENIPNAPEGWKTNGSLAKDFGATDYIINKISEKYRVTNQAWFKEYKSETGNLREYYSPELVVLIKKQFEEKGYKKVTIKEQLEQEQKLKIALTNIESKSIETEAFRTLMSFFGSSRTVDLLYAFHPEFKRLPVEYLKSELAKYLGDYMVVRSGNVLGDVELALPYLGEKSFQESLFTVIKEDAIHYYQVNKKKHKEKEDNRILDEYVTLLKDKAITFDNDDFNDVVSQVESYIFSILHDFDKPSNVIDELNHGRTFPDLNQTINIKEIRDERRVLIGDEMGMGKSASAILSKEYLGVGTALVVVPSNVITTWRRYLSDNVGASGEQLGYFKKGQAPVVLEISSVEDMEKIESGQYDYVIISHERFNEEYAKKLKGSSCEMVIIDEAHKFKNVSDGVRSQTLLDLMQEFKDRDTYTVLLSGTPVPNKIQDLAVTLKLLYPEEFGEMDNSVLVSSIIKGDNINLRDLLFKKTQMKKLAESVDMPEKVERKSFVEFSEQERELYELLLDDDELTATEKLQTLRQFCLNPRKVFPDIEIESSKITEAKRAIETHFETHNKMVFFVNGYIDGIIRGRNSILEQMNLSSDITVKIIDGNVSKEERAEIERDLKYMTHGKVLLVLSGMAADVGVDFSSAEGVYFYNEPWTKFDKMQQQARVYRPGLTHDITVDTSLTRGSVEEGIHYYLEMKYKAVRKLLEGAPLTEIEQSMLLFNEKVSNDKTIEGDQGLAEEWLQSPVNRLNRFFGATKEIGEKKMHHFVQEYGEEYAEYYAEMGTRGFQANTARLVTAFIKKYREEKGVDGEMTILDVASGPEMLAKKVPKNEKGNVFSIDINPAHFNDGTGRQIVAGFSSLPIRSSNVDYLNMSLAVHYSTFRPSRGEFERLEVFGEMARVLKVGGRATINLVYSHEWKNKETLNNLLKELGLRVVESCTGLATSGGRFMSECLTFEKIEEINIQEKIEELKNGDRELLDGLKILTNGKIKLKKSQEIINTFSLNGNEIKLDLNEEDTKLLIEQEEAYDEWKLLVAERNGIENIKSEDLLKRSILRYISGSKTKFVKKGSYSKSFIRLN